MDILNAGTVIWDVIVMTDIELKSCPFCGSKAEIEYYNPASGFGSFSVECNKCRTASGSYTHEHQVIEAWNRRLEDLPVTGLSQDYFNTYREDLE